MTHSRDADRAFDALLVTRSLSGDRKAGERLAARWHPRLARTARRILRDDEAALDAAQEAWLAIARGLPSLSRPERFAAWAFGILRRKCADAQRRIVRERAAMDPDSDAEPQEAARAENRSALVAAFAALPEDQRLCAALFFSEGLTLAEISQAAGVPAGTVKSRLFHARRKLRLALKGDDDDTH